MGDHSSSSTTSIDLKYSFPNDNDVSVTKALALDSIGRQLRSIPHPLNLDQPQHINNTIISPSLSSGSTPTNSVATLASLTSLVETSSTESMSQGNQSGLADQRTRSPLATTSNGPSSIPLSPSASSSSSSPPFLKPPTLHARSSNYTPSSPCFVHSHLDQIATARPNSNSLKKDDYDIREEEAGEEDEQFIKLIETAGSVREMSKQLGK